MSSAVSSFVSQVQNRFANSQSIEHAYRPAIQQLLESLNPNIQAINDGKRTKAGAPDFQIFHKDLPVAFLEAKDITVNLDKELTQKNQITKYQALGNLCFTNNLDWIFYMNDQELARVSIGIITDGCITLKPENYDQLENLLKDFLARDAITVRSANQLARRMAAKARLIKDVIYNTLESDEPSRDLLGQYDAFKKLLIHTLTHEEFSDIYAQTLTYGFFSARFYDPTLPTFSRQEAGELLPKSNPFLRKFFHHLAGPDLDDRIKWIIDDLINLFLHVDVKDILHEFGSSTGLNDPIIHFYETFLGEYDPAKRKAKGVYYTPQPVVDFIVRAVDDILKTDFGFRDGLADTSTITHELTSQEARGNSKVITRREDGKTTHEIDMHQVQILDPATGTGTFLLAVLKQIHKRFEGMVGMWDSYVKNHLMPRVHGFEIMMASYTIAHLKLAMYLSETGANLNGNERLGIYLTNSLEEGVDHEDGLFSMEQWLSDEGNHASNIKTKQPVMVVLGNPPYSVSSQNKGAWIQELLKDYKKDLNEKKINLDDDYIKFIRYGQEFINKNGEGVLVYISNNSFLDGITHRQMRKSLLETFDTIYIYDLHGNSKKMERSPDGTKDENVFDIMQGVSINIFIKKRYDRKPGTLATIYHRDSYGRRHLKYDKLNTENLKDISWQKLEPHAPNHFFTPKDFSLQAEYEQGIKLDELFGVYSIGVETQNDKICVHFDHKSAKQMEYDFLELSIQEFKSKHQIFKEGRDWQVTSAQYNVVNDESYKIQDILYRPFDVRKILYSKKVRGVVALPRHLIMKNMENQKNFALCCTRLPRAAAPFNYFITSCITDKSVTSSLDNANIFPLYIYMKIS